MDELIAKLVITLALMAIFVHSSVAAAPSISQSERASAKSTSSTMSAISSAIMPSGMVDQEKLLIPGELPDIIEGAANAPITIVEYYSLSCGHCADFHLNDLPTIRKEYIDTGKVRLVKREYPYDSRAVAGFMLARCAPKEQYDALIDVFFAKFMSWVAAPDALPPLKKIAKLSGFTDASFKACLQNEQLMKQLNASYERAKTSFGVTASPTFFINGEKYVGALTADEMSKILNSLLRHV